MGTIRTVLITGATGGIGRDLSRRLADRFEVRSGVRREVTDLPNPVMCKLREFESVRSAVEGADAVIHLAAQAWENDVYRFMIPDNVTGCYNVFEASRQAGVKRVVFASTNHVVGKYLEEGRRVAEDVPVRPDTIYAVTKVFGEALGRYYAERHGLSVISARIGWFLPAEQAADAEHARGAWWQWISPRDMAHFMERCLRAEGITYEVLNCASDNGRGLLDVSRAKKVIGYRPQDDFERLLSGPP
jgi:nucleoside-diphosphate-sugar epimerase